MSIWKNLTASERLAAVQTTAAGKNIEDRTVEKRLVGNRCSKSPVQHLAMVEYAQSKGYQIAIDDVRRHHEIYLGDPRKTSADKLKTVIRYPIR